jgi:hypothetical protein
MPPMPQVPQAPPHPATLPGVLQIETFLCPLDDVSQLDAQVNAFLAELPPRAAVIDRQLVVAEGRVTLMLVIKVISEGVV